eukprot:3400571-Alexandrium_andersonii.AAC.1
MSASLVGSEMCIRDSACACAGACACAHARIATGRCAVPLPCMCPRTKPVSYTHLTLPTICSV